MVPSARLVRASTGARPVPPVPAPWLAVRNGTGFTLCCTAALPGWLYGVDAGREEPPFAAGSEEWEIGAAPPEGEAAEAEAGVRMLASVPAPFLSFEVHPCASSKTRAIERTARCFTLIPPPAPETVVSIVHETDGEATSRISAFGHAQRSEYDLHGEAWNDVESGLTA